MMPGSFAFCYIGYLGKSTASDNAKQLVMKMLITLAAFAVSTLCAKIFIRYRTRHIKQKEQSSKKACDQKSKHV